VCLILLAVDANPQYPLVVAANRDEFFGRPSAPAGRWPDEAHIVGGRDLEKGGSWLAVAQGGRLAAVTNYRDGKGRKPASRSRGLLVSDFVRSRTPPQAFLRAVQNDADLYDGFNLIIADCAEVWHFSNISRQISRVTPGVHGLSNHLLDSPWPKVVQGKAALERAITSPREDLVARLFDALREERLAPDHELPSTGIALEWERVLSPAFISTPDYGTRASTVVLVERSGAATLIERSHDRNDTGQSPLRTYVLSEDPASLTAP
jgi:uncharacterized protein with NRDE domain